MKTRLILTYIFNVFDLIATLILLSVYGMAEINPFGEALLGSSAALFYKLLFVPAMLLIIWLARKRSLSKYASWAVFAVYACLTGYHIVNLIVCEVIL